MEKVRSIITRKDMNAFLHYMDCELDGDLNRYAIQDDESTQLNLLHGLAGIKLRSTTDFLESCVRTLLDRPGIDVNFTGKIDSNYGVTAAHIAVQWINVPVLKILIDYDCDLLICDSNGQNVQDWAEKENNIEIIQLIDLGISKWFDTHYDLYTSVLQYPRCAKEDSPFRQKSIKFSSIPRHNSKSSLNSYEHKSISSQSTKNLSISDSLHADEPTNLFNNTYNIPNDNSYDHSGTKNIWTTDEHHNDWTNTNGNNRDESRNDWSNHEQNGFNNNTNYEEPKDLGSAKAQNEWTHDYNDESKDELNYQPNNNWCENQHEKGTDSLNHESRNDCSNFQDDIPKDSLNSITSINGHYGESHDHTKEDEEMKADKKIDSGKETQEAHESCYDKEWNAEGSDKNDNYSYNDWNKNYGEDAKEKCFNDNKASNNDIWTNNQDDKLQNDWNENSNYCPNNQEKPSSGSNEIAHNGDSDKNEQHKDKCSIGSRHNQEHSEDYWNNGQAICQVEKENPKLNEPPCDDDDQHKNDHYDYCQMKRKDSNSHEDHENGHKLSWNSDYQNDYCNDKRKDSYSHDEHEENLMKDSFKVSDSGHTNWLSTDAQKDSVSKGDTTYYHEAEEYQQDNHHSDSKRLSGVSDVKYERTPNESFDSTATEIYTYHDQTMDVELIEERFRGASRLIDEQHKTERALSQNRSKDETDVSGHSSFNRSCESVESTIDELILKMTDTQLYCHLKEHGVQPGPVNSQTRKVYEKKANRMINQPTSPYSTPTKYSLIDAIRDEINEGRKRRSDSEEEILYRQLTNYPLEFNNLVKKKFPFEEAIQYESMLIKEFDQFENVDKDSRNTYFCYLILDPHISDNLPDRANVCLERMLSNFGGSVGSGLLELLDPKLFASFLLSIFYVGKGHNSRAYQHFYDALKVVKSSKTTQLQNHTPKIDRILKIWEQGKGPVSLHCFQGINSDEAFTREALMIEVLSLSNLTNQISGQYRCDLQLNRRQRNILGTYLLFKAFIILLLNGERQVKMPTK